ncbi:transcription factor EMB1444-like [Olea europaea subsp. europaea]|uniref:Transcription factor EMB1444-like n=1 Tax=Olea europaea subsp. europaea TaxID=158383 RepID=A0A8S0PNR2_OLEEU|nr:transcription factor EMB1444-like [Olea europaea subsp. europaea]
MGINSLRSFLQRLCCNSQWSYAVFWKLKHQHEMIFVWEDGFCGNWKLRDPMEGTIDDFSLKYSNDIFSSAYKSSVHDENPSENPIALAVADMSNAYHVFGKGVVGEAACTGNPRWIYSDSMATDEFCSSLVAECPQEWLVQFLAGITTILLLPVLPHGVLQLGSMEMVAEDAAIGAYLKAEFEAHKNFVACDGESPNQQFSHMSTLMENLEEQMITDKYKMNENQKGIDGNGSIHNKISTANQNKLVHTVPDLSGMFVKDVPYTLEDVIESRISRQSLGMIHAAEPQLMHSSREDNKSDITESNIFNSFCLEENISTFSYSDDFDMRMWGEYIDDMTGFYTEPGVTLPTLSAKDCHNSIRESGGNIFSFPGDSELHKALGQEVSGNPGQYQYDLSISDNNVACSLIPDSDLTCSLEFSGMGTRGFSVKEDDFGHSLEDLVANARSNTDDSTSNDNSSNKFNCASSTKMSTGFLAASKRHIQSEQVALVEEDPVPWNFASPAFMANGRNSASYLSPSASSLESAISVLTHEQKQRKGNESVNPGKGLSLSSTNKKRVRAGDKRKPRPRDRQLIQDRIKELRELVPNGAKCSIDGLLDRTFKHMLFLRSVTDRADKLRQQALKEVTISPTSL